LFESNAASDRTRYIFVVLPFKPTESLDAYDYLLRGMAAFNQWTEDAKKPPGWLAARQSWARTMRSRLRLPRA
jgi:hypothetical protein